MKTFLIKEWNPFKGWWETYTAKFNSEAEAYSYIEFYGSATEISAP